MIAIDPGAIGGIAWICQHTGQARAENMPVGMTAICDKLRYLKAEGQDVCILENVGGYMPGNSGPAAVTFARHMGNIEAAAYCAGISVELVTPAKWMKALGFAIANHLPVNYKDLPEPDRKKARAIAKKANKRDIKEAMARRYPHLSVTLNTADALAILTWAMSK